MKIVRIIARLNIGGPARNAVLLAEGLSGSPYGKKIASVPISSGSRNDNAWETVLVCGEAGAGEGDMMYLAEEKGIRPVIVPELGRELSFWDDWRAFWKIYGIIRRERPDIVHTHTAKAGALGRLAGGLYRLLRPFRPRNDRVIILVHTFHGHVLHSYFGKVKTWFFIWIEKILALFTDRIITVSEGLKRELVEKYRIAPEKKFSVIELGFELDDLLKLETTENSDHVNIGIVGRLTAVKNHRMLFRVIKHISEIASAPISSGPRNDMVPPQPQPMRKRVKYDVVILTTISIFVLAVASFMVYTNSKNMEQVAGLVSGKTTQGRASSAATATRPDEMVSRRWKLLPGNVPVLSSGVAGGEKRTEEL